MTQIQNGQRTTTPPALVAIAVAARKSGDRDLERSALRELRKAHGIKLSFAKGAPDAK